MVEKDVLFLQKTKIVWRVSIPKTIARMCILFGTEAIYSSIEIIYHLIPLSKSIL